MIYAVCTTATIATASGAAAATAAALNAVVATVAAVSIVAISIYIGIPFLVFNFLLLRLPFLGLFSFFLKLL